MFIIQIFIILFVITTGQCTNKTILVGDVGGTNIRFALVQYGDVYAPVYERKYLVRDYQTFQSAVLAFFQEVDLGLHYDSYPTIAVFAFAGPIQNNTVVMTNVRKWNTIDGDILSSTLRMKIILLNDFVAAAYGVSSMPASNFISVNGREIDKNKLTGVFGPGTGLGNAIIHPGIGFGTGSGTGSRNGSSFVLTSEGGHSDMGLIDDQTLQFAIFLKEKGYHASMSVEKSISGRTIPLIFQFYRTKMNIEDGDQPSSEQIFALALLDNPPEISKRTLELYLKFYTSAVGNFIVHHMCTGGVYLIGSITNALAAKLQLTNNILQNWIARHPQLNIKMEDIPIVISKQEDLGLFGSFIIAKRYLQNQISSSS